MSKVPKFSILHTSARPHKWQEIFQAWMSAARFPMDVEYILCVDERWGFKTAEGFAEKVNQLQSLYNKVSGPRFQVVWNEGRRCYVDGVNTAARAATGDVLIVNADDQYPMKDWDSYLWQMIPLPPDEKEFVVEVTTGTPQEHERDLLVMPILSRARYSRLGYVFWPEYESMYADQDFCLHARQDNVVIDARNPDVLFPHKHPMFDEKGWVLKDQIQKNWTLQYAEQNRKEAYQLGEVLLKWRMKIRFGQAIAEADKLEGWMSQAELLFLSKAASQCDTVVELGSWKGRSTYAICSGTSGNVYAVDRWDWKHTSVDNEGRHLYEATPAGEDSMEIYDDFRKNTDCFTNLLPVRKDSVESAKTLPDADMVFIDGGHSYEQVKADILAWLPKTKKLICGHDYSGDPGHVGVVKAVNELIGPGVQVKPGTTIWYKELAGAGTTPSTGMSVVPNGKIIVWCLPGEEFKAPILAAILKLYAYLTFKGYTVVTNQAWTSSPYVTREALRLSIEAMPVKPHYVLWSDDDNPVSPEAFDKLMADLDAGVDCVAGWTWVDMYNGSFAVSAGIFSEDKTEIKVIPPKQINTETNLIEVEWHGFPVVLMKYDVLVKAGDKPFAGIPAPNSRWGMTGEDVAFCTNLKARSEYKLYVDPLVFVPHLKFGAIGPAGRQDTGATVEEMSKI